MKPRRYRRVSHLAKLNADHQEDCGIAASALLFSRGRIMPPTTASDMATTRSPASDQEGLSGRLTRAFQAEELAATKRAMQASPAAMAGIIDLLFVLLPLEEVFYCVGVLLRIFAMMVVVHHTLRTSLLARSGPSWGKTRGVLAKARAKRSCRFLLYAVS